MNIQGEQTFPWTVSFSSLNVVFQNQIPDEATKKFVSLVRSKKYFDRKNQLELVVEHIISK